jgi:DNA-binding Lrp family transcriptional regulator
LDPIDLRILESLQTDASVSNQALASRVHVSPATCLRRVKRLVDAGIVERRVAILSPQRLGHGLTAIVEVTLDRQSAEVLAAFEARAVAEDAVRQCHRVSPGPDLILTVQLADMAAYHALVQRLFTADANVRNIKAFFSVHRAKFETRIALPASGAAFNHRAPRSLLPRHRSAAMDTKVRPIPRWWYSGATNRLQRFRKFFTRMTPMICCPTEHFRWQHASGWPTDHWRLLRTFSVISARVSASAATRAAPWCRCSCGTGRTRPSRPTWSRAS